jgi:RNA recognition motif-containing protein
MNRFGEGMKLFVGNMPSGASERKLRDIFEAFGPVGECSILEDRGYGFVHFVSSEDAREAVSKLNGAEFEGSRMSVEVCYSYCFARAYP